MKWLHLSDIHFNYKNYDSENLKKSLIDVIRKISDISFITITGDCLYRYDNDESRINELKEYIQLIGESCGIDKSKIYITPGNHDVNRNDYSRKQLIESTLSKNDNDINIDDYEKLKSMGYDRFKLIHKNITGRDYVYDDVIRDNGYNIINIDTCLTYSGDDSAGKLLCCLKDTTVKDSDAINIVIMHHGMDFFKTTYSRRFQNWAEDNGIDIVLCGHSHKSGIKSFDDISSGLKQFTCGAALVDDYAIPNFYIYDYNPQKEIIYVNSYTYSKDISKWVLDSNHNRAFHNGTNAYYIPRKTKYVTVDRNRNTEIELLSDDEEIIIKQINEKFKDVYSDDFYSSKTGQKEGFNAETAIYSIVQMNVPYIYALQIVNTAVNTICSKEYRNKTSNREIYSSDFRKVVYNTILNLSSNEKYRKEDINTLASKYARRYGHDAQMTIIKNEKERIFNYDYVTELFKEIVKSTTDIDFFKLTNSEKSSIEDIIVSFIQHLDVYRIENKTIVDFLKAIITSPPHPWILEKGREIEIRSYHKEKAKKHLPTLKKDINELSLIETIYHSAALFISYYSRIIGCSEKYPLFLLEKGLIEIINNNYTESGYVAPVSKVEFAKDLNTLGIDKYELLETIQSLIRLLTTPLDLIFENEIKVIEEFVSFSFLISDYIDNRKNRIISVGSITDCNSIDEKIVQMSRFFSSINGVFTKKPLVSFNHAFWITPNFQKSPLEAKCKQILVVFYSEENNDKLSKYLEQSNCNHESCSVILVKPSLETFNENEVKTIQNNIKTSQKIYYFCKNDINLINSCSDRRHKFKEILLQDV